MKLVIVGPGIMPIPPTGWGAVESLIWDYKVFLDKYHPEITTIIVNIPDMRKIIDAVNSESPDVVHIQYDDHAPIVPHLRCKKVLMTSHYGYLHKERIHTQDRYNTTIFQQFVKSTASIACLSPEIADLYRSAGVPDAQLYIQPNGANDELFRYAEVPAYPDRSIYLAKIDYRKRQHVYQEIPNLYFAGNCADARFNQTSHRYLGEWRKPILYNTLTDYANLVLLSDGEAHALVGCEALICGLGLVVSEYAAANLDLTQPFIDVIPTAKLNDIAYVTTVIEENRKKSVAMRPAIRAYGLANFSWKVAVERYVKLLNSI
jgi:glycosyltransferase involved in cell wall biosynthesis